MRNSKNNKPATYTRPSRRKVDGLNTQGRKAPGGFSLLAFAKGSVTMKSNLHHADTAGRIALGPTKLPATPVAFAEDVAAALGLSKSHPGTARVSDALNNARSCVYNMRELPGPVNSWLPGDESPDPGGLRWSSTCSVPAVGTEVVSKAHGNARGKVVAYFVEHGWLGLHVAIDNGGWKRSDGVVFDDVMVFGVDLVADTGPATDGGAKSDGMLTGFEVTNDEFARVKQLALQAVGGDMYHWELLRLNIDKLLLKRMYKGASKGMSSLAETIGSRGAAHGAAGEPQTGFIVPHETRRASPGPVDDGSPSMLAEQDAQSARTLAATMAREGGVA